MGSGLLARAEEESRTGEDSGRRTERKGRRWRTGGAGRGAGRRSEGGRKRKGAGGNGNIEDFFQLKILRIWPVGWCRWTRRKEEEWGRCRERGGGGRE